MPVAARFPSTAPNDGSSGPKRWVRRVIEGPAGTVIDEPVNGLFLKKQR
jgi:hypothetical protein